jgi:hypothetical protein
VVEGDVQDTPRRAGGVHHGLAFDGVARDRLLAQHVQSPFEGRDGDGCVQEGRHRHADRIQVTVLQHVFPAGEGIRNGVFGLQRVAEVLFHARQRHDADAFQGSVGLQVLLSGPANADDTHPQLW